MYTYKTFIISNGANASSAMKLISFFARFLQVNVQIDQLSIDFRGGHTGELALGRSTTARSV